MGAAVAEIVAVLIAVELSLPVTLAGEGASSGEQAMSRVLVMAMRKATSLAFITGLWLGSFGCWKWTGGSTGGNCRRSAADGQ